ncbi:MAG: MMPL family transporter [Actinomycetota bacterium]|nr:MMPL family transporter [Actinomycetota bacterium]
MRLSPRSLARISSRRPWLTIAIWLLAVAASGVITSRFLADGLTTDVDLTNQPEAKQAQTLLAERMRGPERDTEIVILASDSATVEDPAFRGYVDRVRSALTALGPGVVEHTQSYYDSGEPGLVSNDRRTTLVPVVLAGPKFEANEHIPAIREVIAGNQDPRFRVQVSGLATLNEDFNTVAEEDLRTGEGFGILAALIILVVVFGAVVAAFVPILVALASIALAVALVALVGQVFHFSFFVTNIITMMGLAVGIDYSLFVVSRYREERRRGLEKLEAIEAAGGTASRAVFFSGMTVVLALAGMLIIPNTIFRSLGAGAIFVVIVAVVASLTVLPAVLGLLGDRVNALRVRRRAGEPRSGGFWDRVTRGVMHRPVAALVVGVGLLVLAAVSAFDMRTGFSGVSTVPDELASKQAFETLARNFPGGLSAPVEIVIDGPVTSAPVRSDIERLRARLDADGFFGPPRLEVNPAGDLALISAPLRGDPNSKAAVNAIGRVRDDYVPTAFPDENRARVLVGGDTAFNKDFFEMASRYMPIVFGFVLGLSFVLLTVAFRSVVVPLKAIALNLLSVGAAYGLIVLVSQKGVGAGILGFQQVEVIDAWIPLFLFSVLFGLSMDYHVFLLSRIREHFDQTGDNTESVAYGLQTTAGIITGAALIMVAVFAGFASGRMVAFQQMGFGLAVAVLIDATIVRSILVPASMKLLGNRNWYLPRWLGWLPRLQVEETPTAGPVPHLATVGAGPGERRNES